MPTPATLILQSYRADGVAPWLARCLASVADWAWRQGHDRLLLDDGFFAIVPRWYVERCGAERLPVTDLARLLWMRRFLDEGRPRVIWLDADVLVIDPAAFAIGSAATQALGREYWVWRAQDGALRARWAVNNCVMQFTASSTLLDFYIEGCQTVVRTAATVGRLTAGPTLLTALNAAVPLPLVADLATLSPTLVDAIARGTREPVDFHADAWRAPVHAAHLCHSVVGSDGMGLIAEPTVEAAIDRLLRQPALLG